MIRQLRTPYKLINTLIFPLLIGVGYFSSLGAYMYLSQELEISLLSIFIYITGFIFFINTYIHEKLHEAAGRVFGINGKADVKNKACTFEDPLNSRNIHIIALFPLIVNSCILAISMFVLPSHNWFFLICAMLMIQSCASDIILSLRVIPYWNKDVHIYIREKGVFDIHFKDFTSQVTKEY